MGRGCFWGSGVKDVYAQPLTPPSVSDYLFGSNPTIHVYASALEAYQNSKWAEYGTIVGDLTDEIVDEMADGIEGPKDFKDNLYNLSGQRIQKKQTGIIIKNGKKIIQQ